MAPMIPEISWTPRKEKGRKDREKGGEKKRKKEEGDGKKGRERRNMKEDIKTKARIKVLKERK